MTCCCQIYLEPTEPQGILEEFFELRRRCPALQLLVPAGDLRGYENAAVLPRGDSHQYLHLILAFERIQLHSITRAIHSFAIDPPLGKQLTQDARNRIRELLYLQSAENIDRHVRGRGFRGSIMEFL